MDRTGAVLIAIIIVSASVVGMLSYRYLDGGQEAYTGTPDDGSQDAPDGTTDGGTDPGTGDDGSTEDLQLAPDFNLPRVGGGTRKLSDLRGRVVVLDFMATWCGPCATEMGHLREIASSYGTSQVTILSIDVDSSEGEELLVPYIQEHGITWDVLMDTSGVNNQPGYQVSAIPTLVIVDQTGHIAYRGVGITDADTLRAEINALL